MNLANQSVENPSSQSETLQNAKILYDSCSVYMDFLISIPIQKLNSAFKGPCKQNIGIGIKFLCGLFRMTVFLHHVMSLTEKQLKSLCADRASSLRPIGTLLDPQPLR